MSEPKFLLSDIGNVLVRVDVTPFIRAVAARLRRGEDEVESVLHRSTVFHDLERGTITPRQFSRICLTAIGSPALPLACDEFERMWAAEVRFDAVEKVIALWHQLAELLTIVSASNCDPLRIAAIEERHPHALRMIDVDATHSYRLGRRKGDPDYFDRLLRTIGARPEECIYVDDREEFVAHGIEKGIRAIWFADTTEKDYRQLCWDLVAHGIPQHLVL